ncbi:MAG: glucose 1-dehydrogenase [Sphingomonadales bacterium]|nr:MAG: glucose 1-dehydrogenase [Sphingomonadales bacterium]
MQQRFVGKAVLVTGGGSGIGRATAIAFAREGARVVVVDRHGDTARATVATIASEGGTASAFEADVSSFAACQAMVEHSVATYGGLHIAFNNAGIEGPFVPNFTDYSVEDWDRVIAVNQSGIFYAMKAEVPAMRRSGGTPIINTASAASFLAAPAMPAYIASKHGVAGLTKAAALDLIREGIRVNAICPGYVETGMMAALVGMDEAARDSFVSQAPINRVADPSEMAEVVLFMASDAASYLVGSLLRADGGLTVT